MINKAVIFLAIILLFSNCSIEKKFIKLFEEGVTQEQPFKVEIPFEYRLGLIIIKVEINNETYDFVLDSGGVNLLSKELAEKLNRKGIVTQNVGGHQGDYQPMDFTKIEELAIGGVKFEEVASGIGDFNQSLEVECVEIDGMIGANLMRLAVWKIDFRNQVITITNNKESFSLGAETKRVPFYTDAIHQPYCNLKINGLAETNVNIDLGSTGNFSVSYENYEKIQRELPENKGTIRYGAYGSGYYGFSKIDSTYYLQVSKLSFGEVGLDNQILIFSKSASSTIGTAFFKNYDLIMNWNDSEILLTPHTEYENQKLIDNGITINFKDNALRIASIILGSQAENLGLKLGDVIIGIDGKDYTNIDEEGFCNFILRRKGNDKVTNLVISRDGEKLSFDLKNNIIIE